MKRIKLVTVLGTRPEIIRLSAIINKLDASEAFNHILVHTGQHYDYELSQVFFDEFNIRKPDYFLNASGDSPVAKVGNILIEIDNVLDQEKPDAFLVLGDTNSCLAAIAAKRKKIPIFHMEAGNRCFDSRVPEETNRIIVDHLADINLPYTDISRANLIREGFSSDRIIKTGSPLLEVIQSNMDAIENSNILEKLNLKKKQYYLVSTHREENVDTDNFIKLISAFNDIAEEKQLTIIFSAHPRTKRRLVEEKITLHPLINIIKPLGFIDFVNLQINAKAVLSDSGTISEEASILKLKALNLREAHERLEAYEEGAVMMVGVNPDRIKQGLKILESQPADFIKLHHDYDVQNVSDKVLRIIIGYIDYVNRVIWQKKDN